MSIMQSVIGRGSPAAPKVIVYGPPGVGKTTFAARAGNCLIVDLENGASNVARQRTPYLQSWAEAQQWLTAAAHEQHGYDAIAVDSLDWLLRRVQETVTGPDKLATTLNNAHGGYGNGGLVLENYVYGLVLPALDRISARGVAVIMLAHAVRRTVTDAAGVTVEKLSPDVPQKLLMPCVEWADAVLCLTKDGSGQRVFVTQESPRVLAKNRYAMPETVAADWNTVAGYIMAAMAANEEQE